MHSQNILITIRTVLLLLNPSSMLYSHISFFEDLARLIKTAGHIGMDESGNLPKGFEQQIELALRNVKRDLVEAEAMIRNITNVTIYRNGSSFNLVQVSTLSLRALSSGDELINV